MAPNLNIGVNITLDKMFFIEKHTIKIIAIFRIFIKFMIIIMNLKLQLTRKNLSSKNLVIIK